jgi:hypothetical protein
MGFRIHQQNFSIQDHAVPCRDGFGDVTSNFLHFPGHDWLKIATETLAHRPLFVYLNALSVVLDLGKHPLGATIHSIFDGFAHSG